MFSLKNKQKISESSLLPLSLNGPECSVRKELPQFFIAITMYVSSLQ